MRKKPAIAFTLACLLIVFLIGYYFLWRERDEQIINRRLNEIVELAEKSRNEAPLLTMSQSREILQYISQTPQIQFGPPLPVIRDRESLGAAILQVRQAASVLEIRIIERTIRLAPDSQSAEMQVEAEANVSHAGEGGTDRRRFVIEWVKEDGEWVIERVHLLQGTPLPGLDLPL